MDTQTIATLDIPCLKGSRDYVHSTQMFDAVRPLLLNAGAASEDRLTMIFRRLTGRLPRVVMPARRSPYAFGDVVVTGSQKIVATLEETDGTITGRRPDHEAELFASLIVGDGWIAAPRAQFPLSPVEIAVAATKHLHHLQISSSVRWLATRLDLPMDFDATPDDDLRIEIASNRNDATTNAVLVNGTRVGSITFNGLPRAH